MAQDHDVKSVQPHFDDVCAGLKTAEIRLDDRGYSVGDILRQHEYAGDYTGRFIAHEITHKLTQVPGLADGYCMLSLGRISIERPMRLVAFTRMWDTSEQRIAVNPAAVISIREVARSAPPETTITFFDESIRVYGTYREVLAKLEGRSNG